MLITIASDDRRYRIELAEGEVCIHDDLGQKVHLTRDGIVIKTDQKVTIDAPLLDVSGDITSGGNISDSTRSMAADRQIYDGHNHIAAGSITSPPQQPE
jgi:phage gp45-like